MQWRALQCRTIAPLKALSGFGVVLSIEGGNSPIPARFFYYQFVIITPPGTLAGIWVWHFLLWMAVFYKKIEK
jgi:hypothetical protein